MIRMVQSEGRGKHKAVLHQLKDLVRGYADFKGMHLHLHELHEFFNLYLNFDQRLNLF